MNSIPQHIFPTRTPPQMAIANAGLVGRIEGCMVAEHDRPSKTDAAVARATHAADTGSIDAYPPGQQMAAMDAVLSAIGAHEHVPTTNMSEQQAADLEDDCTARES